MALDLTSSLRSHFGFDNFRQGQEEAIQSLLSGQHTLVVMPTGAGKSLIYELSALQLPGLTLIISPLIALMKDQVDSLARHNIPATFINSTLPTGEQDRRLKKLAAGDYRLVYIAPERLRSAPFLAAVRRQKISLFAIDEAHCISEWGHDFRPDYFHLSTARATLGYPLTVALTATATLQVQDDILARLGLAEACRVVTGFNRPNLFFDVRYTSDLPAKLGALQRTTTLFDHGTAIVYVGTRRDAEEVAEFLRQVVQIRAEHYHAGLEASERSRIQEDFLDGDLPVVVATNAFGMGIDRPDVRQVIHYSLPGSLEAYYQEAGRAGRDGEPARAVLLYTPQDRALQEFFIENSAITPDELRSMYNLVRGEAWLTIEDFSRLTGQPEVKVRLGLAALERAGSLERLGDEGLRMLLRCGTWDVQAIQAGIDRSEEHQRHRKAQLERMIAYAETNACRRRILLEYFGDHIQAIVDPCCDNCQVQHPPPPPASDIAQMPQPQQIALIILDTVHRQRIKVGREKLAQILKGSQTKDIQKHHYDRNTHYGRLAVFRKPEIEALITQLIQGGYLKTIGGKYPVVILTPQGEAAIHSKATIPLHLPRQVSPEEATMKKAERQAGGTLAYTAQLIAAGLTPEQIASQRGLALTTIYGHLARLIAADEVDIDDVIPREKRRQIEAAISLAGSVQYLMPIKELLPDEIDYNVIRCVVEWWKKSQYHPENIQNPKEDMVQNFLSRPHPRRLTGPWQAGWAIDFHSRFSGSEWNRSLVGDLTYRLKYSGDLETLPLLVKQAMILLADHPQLSRVEAIVPVPPSTNRPSDPVWAFAEALSERLGIAILPAVIKTRQTEPQKEMRSLAQKHANVSGAFAIQGEVCGKALLVVDDLFDSGTTLEEITRLLIKSKASCVNVLTLTRTIHSDA